MKILFDGRPIRTPLSGVARYCLNLASGIERRLAKDEELYLFCQNWKLANKALEQAKSAYKLNYLVQTSIHPKIANAASEFAPFISAPAKNGAYDILHETYFSNLGIKKDSKKVVTIHDVIPLERPEYFNFLNRNLSKRNFIRQCKEADHIICVSEYTKARVIEHSGYNKEISVIPCGVERIAQKTDESHMDSLGLLDVKYVLYIGNIEPRKNLLLLAEAFKKSKKAGEELRLVVAGHLNFQGREIIEGMSRALGKDLIYLGKVTDAQKWSLYANAEVFVLPSSYEGFGIPIIEAYQSGCVAIFSNNSSMTELAVTEEQMFDEKSIDDMSVCIRRSLDSNSLREGILAKSIVRVKDFCWEDISGKVCDIYKKLLLC